MLMFEMRLVGDPRVVVTATPKPTKIIRDLLDDPTSIITRGTTYDNATNLAPAFLAQKSACELAQRSKATAFTAALSLTIIK
jgi:phage terminase large subunit-like protein